MTWYFEGKEFTSEDIGKFKAFVYLITDLVSGRKYIGKKTFYNKKTLPPLKGQKRKRTKITESDWQSYHGSNEKIKALVDEHGSSRFKREILKLCRSNAESTYYEAKLQFEHDVLLRDDYYNDYIMCRISGSHLRALKD
ncbi:NAD synthetase [Sinorhizobium phage phiN3]|uniref:NAD synthetase n=1 Tax=Sinorhizobium phage phiN3 TaxID=1647405 RepID=A0A0F6WCR8_9CAUD|nr:NAD synthetase [Sinorhizobium phage phiN3]AKF13577.1 NAD synthetase [Sinorhizobium phage phiN3]